MWQKKSLPFLPGSLLRLNTNYDFASAWNILVTTEHQLTQLTHSQHHGNEFKIWWRSSLRSHRLAVLLCAGYLFGTFSRGDMWREGSHVTPMMKGKRHRHGERPLWNLSDNFALESLSILLPCKCLNQTTSELYLLECSEKPAMINIAKFTKDDVICQTDKTYQMILTRVKLAWERITKCCPVPSRSR